jgi:4-hydroxythreonine-4-phosphate dehydrogenase
MKRLPNLIITTGDPAGIGLDLCVMLAFKKFMADITIIGNKDAILSRARQQKKNIIISTKLGSHLGNGELKIINLDYKNPVVCGQLDKSNSLQQLKGLKNSIELCLSKKFDALITLPIHKKILSSDKIKFTGHTEYIANECGNKGNEVMLLSNKKLNVALATTHVSLKDVPSKVTQKSLCSTISTLHHDLRKKFNILQPKITVIGLNPHSGEDGEFGDEEIRIIKPAICKMEKQGILVNGPIPADTAFTPKIMKKTDCYLAMYHDQGLAPFKALTFGKGVNVTLGLPIIRTSVDHGTGLDIAGSNKIDPSSFFESIKLAISLAKNQF